MVRRLLWVKMYDLASDTVFQIAQAPPNSTLESSRIGESKWVVKCWIT